jgi:hypothetical protein
MAWVIVSDAIGWARRTNGCALRWASVLLLFGGWGCEPVRLVYESGALSSTESDDGASSQPSWLEGFDAGAGPGAQCPDFPAPCDGALDKCSLVSESGRYRTACVPRGGELDVGATCQRVRPGYDTCGDGSFCSPERLGSGDVGPFRCERLCGPTVDCPEPRRCLELTPDGAGLCVESCEFLGTDCASGLRCTPAPVAAGGYLGYCAVFGSGVHDTPCTRDAECGERFTCEQGGGVCRQLCNAEFVCPDELRCVPLALGDPQGPRLCVP